MSVTCPNCDEDIEDQDDVIVVKECYQRLSLTDGELSRPEFDGSETTIRILCPLCVEELPDAVSLALGIDADELPYRPKPTEPNPMFVLTQTWREGEYDYARDVTKVVAVAESPGTLIRMVYDLTVMPDPEHGTIETIQGSFKIDPVLVAARKDGWE